jgi:dimethylhistidine N-methyltransferase
LERTITFSKPDFLKKSLGPKLDVYYVNGSVKASTFAGDVKKGLTCGNKYLLPKYFYDRAGSELFEKICSTSEYYVTRTETEILERFSDEIALANKDKEYLVELGSGSSVKTKLIIDSFLNHRNSLHYLPIDVSDIVVSSSQSLTNQKPGLQISGFISDYVDGISLIHEFYDEPKLIIFLGSSIGNFDLIHAEKFVKFIRSRMNKEDSLLIGFDMKKDAGVLNAAYNDKEGYTSKFNLNLLRRINNELGGNFNLSLFKHHAFFNEEQSRIEMHLISLEDQSINVEAIGEVIHFKKGESIYTESSYKFTDEMLEAIAWYSNMKLANIWRDNKHYFSLCLFRPI